MTDNQLLAIWRWVHPLNAHLDFVLFMCTFPVLSMLYIRFRTKFLLIFLIGNLILLLSEIPNNLYPQGAGRPITVGLLIEIMRLLTNCIHIIATFMCCQWFIRGMNSGTPLIKRASEGASGSQLETGKLAGDGDESKSLKK